MKISPNPEIFISAREAEGKTQAEVAKAAGVSQGVISKVEHGLDGMTPEQLEGVASYLGYDPALFLRPERVRSGASACLYHRKRKTLPARILHRLEGRMYLASLHADRLLQDFDIDAERQFHTMDLDDYGSPVEVAQALRRAWRVPPGPIGNLMALIESAGGIVLLADFETRKLFGMSCWSKTGRPVFYLNSAMTTDDLRWTLAHEVGHLVMHAMAPDGDPEVQADEFAGEFLMPRAEAVPQLRNLDFRRLPKLKGYWRVSMKTVIRRAEMTGAISKDAAQSLYKQYNARRYGSGEPYAIAEEQPTLVGEAIRLHFEEHEFTVEDVAAIAGMNVAMFEDRLMGDERPMRRENVIRIGKDQPSGSILRFGPPGSSSLSGDR